MCVCMCERRTQEECKEQSRKRTFSSKNEEKTINLVFT